MKRILFLPLLLLCAALCATTVGAASGAADIGGTTGQGVPNFVRGDLGFVDPVPARGSDAAVRNFELSVLNFARGHAHDVLGAAGGEDLVVASSHVDRLGSVHVRLDQTLHGLPVDGAQLIVHADAATGAVYAVNGELGTDLGVAHRATIGSRDALAGATAELGLSGIGSRTAVGPAALVYVLDADQTPVLAWKSMVRWNDAEGPHADWIYADATTGALVARDATIHTAKSWQTYDGNGRTRLPGTLDCTNNQACSDSVIQDAHDNASIVYDYYLAKFGRDSLDGNGMTMISTAHHGRNYNNAFWNGSQMVYGDGDGSVFSPLGSSLDVVAHELTHGVTDFESDLVYQNESGAINEAMSDIFGAAVEIWVDGGITADAWLIGDEIYTPGTPGDALRYMNNPTIDGSSTDYYPERYVGTSDNGGVHWNSGIANLAFYLMVEGGTHPRGKTTTVVPSIGVAKAEQIFYRAQVAYLTPSSTFSQARSSTIQAALDLYSQADADAVADAWTAVGVEDGGGTGGPGCAEPGGGTVTNISDRRNGQQVWTIDVPECAAKLTVTTTGPNGDADLYVRQGQAPTTSTYDAASFSPTSNETVVIVGPTPGTWYIMIHAYSRYDSLTLDVLYE